jgi:predicted site-specific integrase-resolvase
MIDPRKWLPANVLSARLKVSRQVVHNWIKRGKVKTKEVPEWDMTLVDAAVTPKQPGK